MVFYNSTLALASTVTKHNEPVLGQNTKQQQSS